MGKYVGWTRVYLVVVTVFIVVRFVLEAVGVGRERDVRDQRHPTLCLFADFPRDPFRDRGPRRDQGDGSRELHLLRVGHLARERSGRHSKQHSTWERITSSRVLVAFPIVLAVGTLILTVLCWIATAVNRKLA